MTREQQAAMKLVKVHPRTHCWEWIGGKNPRGYGALRVGNGFMQATRYFWTLFVAPLDPEHKLTHPLPDDLCLGHACVNPAHLSVRRQRQAPAVEVKRCPNRHVMDSDNVVVIGKPDGTITVACRRCVEYNR